MAKISVLSDTHFGFKKSSKVFQDYFEAFYHNVFFPTLEERNIDTVIHIGDVFDNRKIIDYNALNWAKRVVFEPLKKYKVHMVIGNHDVYYNNSNKLNSPNLLLDVYDNISVYKNPTDIKIDNLSISLIPWITDDNYNESMEFIKGTDSTVCFGHLELQGFRLNKTLVMDEGMNKDIFKKYRKVFSGHYHTRSTDGHVHYIGNPYEMFSNDVGDDRGFIIFDTEDLSHEFINNPYQLFCEFYYDEDTLYDDEFYSELEDYLNNKIVKLYVKNKKDHKKYQQFLDKIVAFDIIDLKIIENFEINFNNTDHIVDVSDTLSLLNTYVDEIDNDIDKFKLKGILSQIYNEAISIE